MGMGTCCVLRGNGNVEMLPRINLIGHTISPKGFALAWLCQAYVICSLSSMSIASKLLVDIHTHVYLPRYASLLKSRTSVPFIRSRTTSEGATEDRLLILDHEPSGGRPVGAQYWDREGIQSGAHLQRSSCSV